MKQQRHKRKESFYILLISNTGRSNRQFQISLSILRMLFIFLLILCVALGWFAYQFSIAHRVQSSLKEQLSSQEQLVRQLESEKESLNNEKQALIAENESLRQQPEPSVAEAEETEETNEEEAEAEPDAPGADPFFPSLYPSSDTAMLLSAYSQEQSYLSITVHEEGNIIAAGSGTIITVSSDDTYPLIVEVDHGNGYVTRYMSQQTVESSLEENTQVQAGETLFTIITDNTQLDYQVLLNGEPIDPLSVFDAKG
ncbi:MAG: M23 family metallopeptidase [Lachnospiraceae bacterium]|nr:M23 family metallopeptidase [Lachnospiraceae bacterium]